MDTYQLAGKLTRIYLGPPDLRWVSTPPHEWPIVKNIRALLIYVNNLHCDHVVYGLIDITDGV